MQIRKCQVVRPRHAQRSFWLHTVELFLDSFREQSQTPLQPLPHQFVPPLSCGKLSQSVQRGLRHLVRMRKVTLSAYPLRRSGRMSLADPWWFVKAGDIELDAAAR